MTAALPSEAFSRPVASNARDNWNAARYKPGDDGGHYESWFLRANDPAGRLAFWIRYTIFSPKGRPHDAVGELWAIYFDRTTGKIVSLKEDVPIQHCTFSTNHLNVQIGSAVLQDGRLRGRAGTNNRSIAWDLDYSGGQEPLLLLPEGMYDTKLPRAKVLVGQPLARFRGFLVIDGESIRIDNWVGSQNHNWGSRHTDRYAWGQVAGFDEAPDAFLECSTARVRVGPFWSPWMSPVVLRLRGATLQWNGLVRAVRARGCYQGDHWYIETSGPCGTLQVTFEAHPADFASLVYANPPGGSKVCLNTKIARCSLTLERGGQRMDLHSSRAAFEILDDLPPGKAQPS
nr:hypothetical protein [Rubrivivax pictus]